VQSAEATNTNFINLWLTWPGLESTIYRTRGAHANHYIIDPVFTYDDHKATKTGFLLPRNLLNIQDTHHTYHIQQITDQFNIIIAMNF
jgi:hypothetical protein